MAYSLFYLFQGADHLAHVELTALQVAEQVRSAMMVQLQMLRGQEHVVLTMV